MLYDKTLNITEEDIEKETDLNRLQEWKKSIEMDVINIERTSYLTEDKASMIRANDAKSYKKMMRRQIILRMHILEHEAHKARKKEKHVQEILLMRKFMKLAKQELPKEQYRSILERAKEIIQYKK